MTREQMVVVVLGGTALGFVLAVVALYWIVERVLRPVFAIPAVDRACYWLWDNALWCMAPSLTGLVLREQLGAPDWLAVPLLASALLILPIFAVCCLHAALKGELTWAGWYWWTLGKRLREARPLPEELAHAQAILDREREHLRREGVPPLREVRRGN